MVITAFALILAWVGLTLFSTEVNVLNLVTAWGESLTFLKISY